MYLHCMLVIYLGKSHGAADLFIKGKIAVPPRRLDVPVALTSEGMCLCSTVCSSALHGLAQAPLGTEALESALEVLRSLAVEPWALFVFPEGTRPS